jgi:transcriptional regulator with XRE-family HTH domain
MKIGKKLLLIRKSKKISQAELSLLSGISQSYISDLETEKKTPTLNVIAKLANGLNCSVLDLIEIEKKQTGKEKEKENQQADSAVNI